MITNYLCFVVWSIILFVLICILFVQRGQIAVPTLYPFISPEGNHIIQTQNKIQVIHRKLICARYNATKIVRVLVRPSIRHAYWLVTYFRDHLRGEASPLWMDPPSFDHCHREHCHGVIRAAVNESLTAWTGFSYSQWYLWLVFV